MSDYLQKLVQLANIRHIVYVDDEFTNKDLLKNSCYARCRVISDNKGELPFDYDVVSFDDRFENWWNSADEEKVQNFILGQGLSREKTVIESNLEDLCSDEIHIYSYTPEQCIEDIIDLSSSIPQDENIIFLIDKELNGHIDSSRIIEHIKPIRNKYVALFSETFLPDEEIATWLRNDSPDNVYPLAKSRLDNESFVEGLRNVIWLKSMSAFKKMTIDVLQQSFENVKIGLDAIDPVTFDKTIIDISRDEGCWEFSILLRVMLSMLNKGVQEYMLVPDNFSRFQGITHDIRDIKNVLPHIQYPLIKTEQIQSIQKNEWYDNGEYLNAIFSPINNGDIFSIEESGIKKEYILLCQPCNLAIRSDGKRKNELDYAYLIPIIKQKKAPQFCEKIESLEHGVNTMYADFRDTKRISLDILDLVSFNCEGMAQINIINSDSLDDEKKILQDNMMLRYSSVWKKIHDYYTIYTSIKNSEIQEEKKLLCIKYLQKPYEMGDESLLEVPKLSDDILSFGIRRISRYKEPFVQDLLQKFMRYLSRPGFAPQLTF